MVASQQPVVHDEEGSHVAPLRRNLVSPQEISEANTMHLATGRQQSAMKGRALCQAHVCTLFRRCWTLHLPRRCSRKYGPLCPCTSRLSRWWKMDHRCGRLPIRFVSTLRGHSWSTTYPCRFRRCCSTPWHSHHCTQRPEVRRRCCRRCCKLISGISFC